MRRLSIETMGTEVQGVSLRGNPRNPEPLHFRVSLPFGDVDIVRCDPRPGETVPDYWVHVRVNRPGDNGDPDRDMGRVKDGRFDVTDRHASDVEPGPIADPNLYHLAVRVGPDRVNYALVAAMEKLGIGK